MRLVGQTKGRRTATWEGMRDLDVAQSLAKTGRAETAYLTLDSQRVPDTLPAWRLLYPLLLAAPLKLGLARGALERVCSGRGLDPAALPPLLAISRCRAGSIDANPRLLFSDIVLPPFTGE